ncbi:unnamed protein product, partial [Durusdinium trenchii]
RWSSPSGSAETGGFFFPAGPRNEAPARRKSSAGSGATMDAKELQREQLAKARRTIREHRARQTQFPAKRLSVASACTTRSQKYQYLAEPFVESSLFEFGTGVVIVYSTLTMMLEVDQVEVPFLINFSESFLTSFFLSEWLVRLSVHGPSWLRSIENLLDTFIAWIPGVLTVWFLQPLVAESTGFLKTMRIVRMLRLLRLASASKELANDARPLDAGSWAFKKWKYLGFSLGPHYLHFVCLRHCRRRSDRKGRLHWCCRGCAGGAATLLRS